MIFATGGACGAFQCPSLSGLALMVCQVWLALEKISRESAVGLSVLEAPATDLSKSCLTITCIMVLENKINM